MKKLRLHLFFMNLLWLACYGASSAATVADYISNVVHIINEPTPVPNKLSHTTLAEWMQTGITHPSSTAQVDRIAACLDNAGTSVRTINGNPMGAVTIANFGDLISIVHNLNSNVSSDGNVATTPGVDLAIYQGGAPTVTGPTAAAIHADPANLKVGAIDVVGTNVNGSITFNTNASYQTTYNSGNPVQLWFAHITLDAHSTTPPLLTENAGAADECANVNVSDAFSIIFLNKITFASFQHPVGGNTCAGRIRIRGGLPQWNASNYTVAIKNVLNPAIVGTAISPSATHNSLFEFTVPVPGNYNIVATDANGGMDSTTITMSACTVCTDTAGTVTTTVLGASPNLSKNILCQGDTLQITHNGDADLGGDPVASTPSGLGYLIYTCKPTSVSGNKLSNITSDPCIVGVQVGSVFSPTIVSNININGNGYIINNGILYQSMLGGNAGELWFVPVTFDDFADKDWEGINTPSECVNASIDEAFSVVFTKPIELPSGFSTNICDGSFTVRGGLPEYDGSKYIIDVSLSTNSSIKATITSANNSHNDLVTFTVPQPGLYSVTVSDSAGCSTNAFQILMNACPPPCTDTAGTVTTTLLGSAQSLFKNVLCQGDTLQITHNGDADLGGDPNIATPSGLGYLIYTCKPTSASGNKLNTITSDPCIVGVQAGSVFSPTIVSNIDINGNGYIINNGVLYQSMLGGNVGELWFVPVTFDDFADKEWEGIGGLSECVNASIDEAFSVTFVDPITLSTFSNNLCDGSFRAFGGVPEYDGTTYNISIFLSTNPAITGTITSTTNGHGDLVTFTVPQPGLYTIVVTDPNGCGSTSGSNSFQLLMNTCPFPCTGAVNVSATITSNYNGSPISCNGANDGAIAATVTKGTAPFTYTWSHNGAINTPTISNLSPGNYTLTVTDANGCTASTTALSITEPNALFVLLDETNPLCNSEPTGVVYVSNIGGGTLPYNYTWASGAPVPDGDSIINLLAGSYSLTITDLNGCTATASTNIGDPADLTASFTQITNTDCAISSNGSATITPSGGVAPNGVYTYTWQHTATNTGTVIGLNVGTYYVTVADANGCTVVDSAKIIAGKNIDLAMSSTDMSCAGVNDGTISVAVTTNGGAANLPYTYTWSHDANLTDTADSGLGVGTYAVTVTDALGCFAVDSATVQSPPAIIITVQGIINVGCFGNNSGEIAVSASGGVLPYTYAWSNGDTSASIANLSVGTYQLTVTDANGCSSSDSATVTQSDSIYLFDVNFTPISCAGNADGAINVTVAGGTMPYRYAWSRNPGLDTTATLLGVWAGNYTLTITDINGCNAIETIEMQEPAPLTATVNGTNLTCSYTSDGMVSAVPSGGTMPYTYLWSNLATTDTVKNILGGFYTVTITDAGGCTYTDSVSIFTPTALLLNISTTNVSCPGRIDGTATATVGGGAGGYTYIWDNGQFGQTATQLPAGQHLLIVNDQAGCQITNTFSIGQNSALIPNQLFTTSVSCFGGNDGTATVQLSGGTPPYTYIWNTTPAQDSSTAVNLAAGIYEVSISDALGCALVPVSITVNEPPTALTATLATVNVSCNGGSNGSITAQPQGGTPSYAFQWNDDNNQSSITANNLEVGTYTVTITDANGCSTTASAIVNEPFALFADITTTPTTCNGGKDGRISVDTVLGGTPPYAYSIDGANFLPISVTYFGLLGGSYNVTIRDAANCTSEEVALIEEPQLILVDVGPDLEIDLGDSVQLDAIVNTLDSLTYSWNPADTALSCADCPDPIARPVRTTEYAITVIDTNGCQASDVIRIKVNKNRRVFIPSAFTPNGDGPNDRFLVFGGTGVELVRTMQIFDRWGNLVFTAQNLTPGDESKGWNGTYQGQDAPMGVYVYFVEIVFSDGQVFPYKGDISLLR